MRKIKMWIAKFVCKWADFAGMGNDTDVLQLKKDIADYDRYLSRKEEIRKRGICL